MYMTRVNSKNFSVVGNKAIKSIYRAVVVSEFPRTMCLENEMVLEVFHFLRAIILDCRRGGGVFYAHLSVRP